MKNSYNILLTLMGLEIGGAETHVIELAKGLNKRGFNVCVASNGGVYVNELVKNGITHYKVPLHNKKPFNIIKSYFLLKDIIKAENIDLVHAHARIPAFICGMLHKRMNFSFVTTAHGVFKTEFGLKYITNWGEKTIAVSEDIKKYLMDNYHICEDDIKVTINGIDTKKFSPDVDCEDIKGEFDIKDVNKKIVHISRLNKDTSDVAFQLIKITPDLVKEIDNLKVLIVGEGNMLRELKEKAEEVNKNLKKKVIIITGARTDINKFLVISDVFVGVSRAALEAMATEKPVILVGNQGYLGIFDRSKFKLAIDSNFTCRGQQKFREGVLKSDILKIIKEYSSEKIKEIQTFGRNIVEEKYSVSKMVQDNIEVYLKVLN
ncbi:glycosyltransferase [Tepidibacter thalassicus]|uniref:Glycosyltransferase involved in cell wall bisynthesis n=1 Tax=Tepidibacter thalassicus DSM 15285 TaxID=1123350 RepID=A0A1M5TD39_9FIRM|nr:glycosyltransferase [Tepidibacter thalassicus]SHH48596.1 Glycosyltransferase involved in cell wall bisynthesis [Tepidibacter thalassicus DSM 15285]